MPSVSALLSGGVSAGLWAGVVSGLLYLVVTGLRWAGRWREAWGRQQQLQAEQRAREQAQAQAQPGAQAHREVRQQSGEWLYRRVQRRLQPPFLAAGPVALLGGDDGAVMEAEAESSQVREFIERLVESLVAGGLDHVSVRRLHAHPDYERMFARHHAPLCQALARLSFALQMAIANRHMADGESPAAAHAALKQLVQQVIREARALPRLQDSQRLQEDGEIIDDIDSKTYEDILATAILNKVIEQFQNGSSSEQAARDKNSNLLAIDDVQQPKFLSKLESKHSESERMFRNNSDSLSDVSGADPLSVTVEECIEEVTTYTKGDDEDSLDGTPSGLVGLDIFKHRRAPFPEYGRDIIDGSSLAMNNSEEEEDDDVDEQDDHDDESSLHPTDVVSAVDSWEENWLFQKRKLKSSTAQPMPVPMLVPNPSEDYRALIGDRDAEDVSDLSDCSDAALEDLVLSENPIVSDNSHSVTSKITESTMKTLDCISGQKTDAVTDVTGDTEVLSSEDLTEATNVELIKVTSEDCMSEFGQQEGEYTEDYASVTQRQLDSLSGLNETEAQDIPELPSSPIPQISSECSMVDDSVAAILDNLVPGEADVSSVNSEAHFTLAKPPQPGTIAEREHKKWETATPIPNNPYSSENILKRLSKRPSYNNSTGETTADLSNGDIAENILEQPLQIVCSPADVDTKKYGRDYYVNSVPATNSGSSKKNHSSTNEHQDEMQIHEHQEGNEDGSEKLLENTAGSEETQVSSQMENKVAYWQKEINQKDMYYQNLLNNKPEMKINAQKGEKVDSSAFIKSMLSDDEDENRNKEESRTQENETTEKILPCNGELKNHEVLHTKHQDLNSENRASETVGKNMNVENVNELVTNDASRSISPSGSNTWVPDSEKSMPSVRELTKKFLSLVDIDSSASPPKSISPTPRGRSLERHEKEIGENRGETEASLSPTRAVREIHSLTARSISKGFRDELRHNQPMPLNRNVYQKPGNSLSTNKASNSSSEENEATASRSTSKNPLQSRSMQSNIAFWEKLQKQNL